MRSRPRRRSPRERRSSDCRPTAACRTDPGRDRDVGDRLHRLPASVFVSAVRAVRLELVRAGAEPGVEGWVQYYMHPDTAVGGGLKASLRLHAIGLGPVIPYLEGTAGAGGTNLDLTESRSRFTFIFEAGAGASVFVAPGWPSTRAIASSTNRTAIRRVPTVASTPIRASSACPSSSTDRRKGRRARRPGTNALRGSRVPAILGA